MTAIIVSFGLFQLGNVSRHFALWLPVLSVESAREHRLVLSAATNICGETVKRWLKCFQHGSDDCISVSTFLVFWRDVVRCLCRYDCGLGWTELSPGHVSQPSEVPVAGSVCRGFLWTVPLEGLVRDHDIGCFLTTSVGQCISMFYVGLLQRCSLG